MSKMHSILLECTGISTKSGRFMNFSKEKALVSQKVESVTFTGNSMDTENFILKKQNLKFMEKK